MTENSVRDIYMDCEFCPWNSALSGLISIGLCDSSGREYYAVNKDCDWWGALRNSWLRSNVLAHMPFISTTEGDPDMSVWDTDHPEYRYLQSSGDIAAGVAAYFTDPEARETRLWAWYGAQDMCRLHSLWGNDWQRMPPQIPRWFNDLEQLRRQLGNPELPARGPGEHHALMDARYARFIHRKLQNMVFDGHALQP